MSFFEQPTILESDLEDYLVEQGYDVWDDSYGEAVIDSCKVCDIASSFGYSVLADGDERDGYTFVKPSFGREAQ